MLVAGALLRDKDDGERDGAGQITRYHVENDQMEEGVATAHTK